MILILSKSDDEITTEKVIYWINYYGHSYVRINGASFFKHSTFSNLKITYKDINWDSINAIWYRRWMDDEHIANLLEGNDISAGNYNKAYNYIKNELIQYSRHFFQMLKNKHWVTKPSELFIYKLEQLEIAEKVGIRIPKTILTGKKETLKQFKVKNHTIINKSISNPTAFFTNQNDILKSKMMRTWEVKDADIDMLETHFFPSLFQELIEKEYEIRTFYLDRKFYSMAIFSQLDETTKIDFRNYNEETPNRTIPYKLPDEMEKKLQNYVDELGFTTGSFDLIRAKDGGYVFLEINQVGQFGMTSFPTNYQLEKVMAEYLIKLDNGK